MSLVSLVQDHIDTSTPSSSTRDWPTAPSPITTHDSLSASGHLLCSLATLSAEVDPTLKGQVLGLRVPDAPLASQKNNSSNKGTPIGGGGGGGRNSPKNNLLNAIEESRTRDMHESNNFDISPHLPPVTTPKSSSSTKTMSQRNGNRHGMDSEKVPEGSSQKSNSNHNNNGNTRASFLSLEGIRNAIDQAIEGDPPRLSTNIIYSSTNTPSQHPLSTPSRPPPPFP